MAIKKKKKLRPKRFKTGTYVSTKTGQEINYRSGWERSFAEYLDKDKTVATYVYEGIIISYITNLRSGRLRKYYPDFYVERVDGSKLLIEIKPKRFAPRGINKKKWEAAKKWCEEHDTEFMVITEDELKDMNVI